MVYQLAKCEMFSVKLTHYSLRSEDTLTLHVPKTNIPPYRTYFPPVAGAQQWNCLSQYLKNISDFVVFKKELKTFILS